jgi:P4 family phage/plasmid primase-like protien
MLDFSDADPHAHHFMVNADDDERETKPRYDRDHILQRLRDTARVWVPDLFPNAVPEHGNRKMRVGDLDGNPGESAELTLEGEYAGNGYDFANQEKAGPFELIMRARGITSFPEALEYAAELVGAMPVTQPKPVKPRPDMNKMAQQVKWSCRPWQDSPVATYLQTIRKIPVSPSSDDIRYCAALRTDDVDYCGMVAIVRDKAGNEMPGIHRTFLLPDGKGKAAPDKKTLGDVSPGLIRLLPIDPNAGHLGIAEGIETALSAARIFLVPTWAAMNTGIMKVCEWPDDVKRITIFADADKPGKPPAGSVAANALYQRVIAAGIPCEIRTPLHGDDFNDDLVKGRKAEDYQTPQQPVPGKEKADSKKREKSRFSHLEVARATAEEIGADSVICVGSGIYIWKTGYWAQAPDRLIKKHIHRAVTKKGAEPIEDLKRADVDSVLDLFKTETFRPDHAFNCASSDFVNVANGELFYDGQRWTLKPHCREHYSTSQISIVYDPAARAPRFEQFLQEVFEGDDDAKAKARCVIAMIGYCLLTTTRFERFFILIGRGSNGKSVLLAVIEALLGLRNVSAIQPDQFGNKFQRAHLLGKLANIVTEIKQGAVIDDAALKAIVSGELATAEQKFRDPFDFRPHATCLFGTNHMPATRDFSDAVFRRAVILKFNRKFTGSQKDTKLKDKLTTELPGILNLALQGIAEAISDGDFTEPPSSETAKAEWRKENDQVQIFVEDLCTERSGAWIGSTALYERYLKWADSVGVERKLSQKGLTQRLCYRGIEAKHESRGNILYGIEINQLGDVKDEPVKDV